MYKVFINEKKIILSAYPQNETDKKLKYESPTTLEIAVDLLENTSCLSLNVFGDDLEKVWSDFKSLFKIVKGAGGIVSNKEGKILFIFRMKKWDLPKGKMEKGETPEETSVREVEEETQINNLKLGDFVNSTYHVYTERNGQKILKKVYWYKMFYTDNVLPKPQIEEGITEVKWMDTEEIVDTVLPNTFKNIKLILQDAGVIAL